VAIPEEIRFALLAEIESPRDDEIRRDDLTSMREQIQASVEDERAARTGRFAGRDHVVYYVRVGNRIKIGYTTHLKQRLASIGPEEVLATEPGGFKLEQHRHAQFAEYRVMKNREWFVDCPAIREHIETIKARGGRAVTPVSLDKV
jgi:hypothetical protein